MNKLKKLDKNIYRGTFIDVPSRSGSAIVTLLLARVGTSSGSLLTNDFDGGRVCTLIYEHHEDTAMYVETTSKIIGHFLDDILLEESPVWRLGIVNLCSEIQKAIDESLI